MASHKLGYITASIVSDFLTGKDAETPISGTITACSKIASERCDLEGICLYDELYDGFSGNKYTELGDEYEPDAITSYEAIKFCDVVDQQKVSQLGKWLSCTPDGYVGKDGLVEAKIVSTIKEWLHPDIVKNRTKDHNDQIQFQLMVTGRKWCDLILHQPRFIHPYNTRIIRINVDENWQKFAKTRLKICEQKISEMIQNLKKEFL